MRKAATGAQPAAGPAGVAASVGGARVAVVLYSLVCLLYWASLFTYLPTLPTYAASITPDLALIGTILSMYGLWQALARLPFGIASDWAGWRKPFIVAGLGLAAAGALVMGNAHTPQALLVGRSITGLAAATWVPLTVVFSARCIRPNRRCAPPRCSRSCRRSGGSSRPSSTAPMNALGGYGLAFTVAAVLAGLSALLVLPAREVRRPVTAPTAAGIVRLATWRPVLLPAGLNAVGHYVLMGLVYGFVPLLAKQLGAPDSLVSNLTVVHLAVFTPSVLAAALLLRRFKARPLLLASFVAMALGALCGAFATVRRWADGGAGTRRHRFRHQLPDPDGHEHRAGRQPRANDSDGRPPIGLRDRNVRRPLALRHPGGKDRLAADVRRHRDRDAGDRDNGHALGDHAGERGPGEGVACKSSSYTYT